MKLNSLPKAESSTKKLVSLQHLSTELHLKQKVYRNSPHTLEALQTEIWNVFLDITGGELQQVSEFVDVK
jgi:hypothetical protein